MRVAGIDCGTNSIRLLIADADLSNGNVRLEERLRTMRVVRLGQGVDATGAFSDEALKRTFAAVRDYKQLVDEHEVEQLRFVATSAARDVSNREQFIEGITQILGIAPEVISGEVEANLSFTGATSVLPESSGTSLVIDLGGGSTEFVIGTSAGVQAAKSLDVGCVRVTERFGEAQLRSVECVQMVDQMLAELQGVLDLGSVQQVLVVAGTFTTLTACALGLDRYDSQRIHGARISFEQMRGATGWMLDSTREQRADLGYMHPGRVDVISAGALIVERILALLEDANPQGPRELIASEHDILDGIASSAALLTRD
ncbi:exopolyphosphatase [Glutamicibacter sp. PS]|uniref:Ppx/GppA phosphatase family protein n=1 Tax=Glutamicibacter sp. PS TaxID=3075634 RepID=UPI002852B6B3|nr:exopolyphosphatase [Glutamicibacter sp. PS]